MLNGYVPVFSSFSGEAYDNDVVRSAVDAIARNAAKLKPKHIRRQKDKIAMAGSNIEYILQTRPNPYMDAYTFYYKVVTQYYLQNNSFVFLDWDPESKMLRGLYPINAPTVMLLESGGEIFAKFFFLGGQQVVLPYTDLIHLRRFFYQNDFYGETSSNALNPVLELINTTNDGIANAVKSSAYLRGLLKFTSMLKPDDMKKQRDMFVADYMNITNNGGVAATDAKADYIELKSDPKMIDDKQMDSIKSKVYDYFGVNEKIVKSNYTEEEWNAFYESVIEPIAIQLSLEFTEKIFTQREKGHGNEIIFEANRLQYASNKTKIEVVNTLVDRGMMSLNQGLEMFNLPPIEDGDKRILSLNFIDADKANQYQLGQKQPSDNQNGGDNNGTTNNE
jgi:HK97 family phage portal protein